MIGDNLQPGLGGHFAWRAIVTNNAAPFQGAAVTSPANAWGAGWAALVRNDTTNRWFAAGCRAWRMAVFDHSIQTASLLRCPRGGARATRRRGRCAGYDLDRMLARVLNDVELTLRGGI
jgi:hypothetical protein